MWDKTEDTSAKTFRINWKQKWKNVAACFPHPPPLTLPPPRIAD